LQTKPAITQVLEEVARERARQDEIWGESNPLYKDVMSALTVLMEEVGEMAKAVLEGDLDGLRGEAIQVAAVAVAIGERLTPTADPMSWR
jgi:NTP pyrophosphatase (non-canonical NTP hydrolase)